MTAAFYGDEKVVEALIRAGASVNARTVDGVTALIKAASTDKSECLKSLIKAGADVDANDTNKVSPLMYASFTGKEQCVDVLIKVGASVNTKDADGVTAMMHATFNFRQIHWEAILEVAAGKTPRWFLDPKNNILHRPPNNVKMDIKDGGIGLIPISSPVLRYTKTVDEINDTKPELKAKYTELLARAGPLKSRILSTAFLAENTDDLCVDSLLEAGADVNMRDIHGTTALGYAAYYGRGNLVCKLIKSNANVNTSGENSITPLFLAVQSGHNDCLQKLLHAGANVNAKTDNGFTPLMQAILAGHAKCVDTLIAAGADLNTVVSLKKCDDDVMKVKEAAMITVSSYLGSNGVITDLKQNIENKFKHPDPEEPTFTPVALAVLADVCECVPSLVEAGAHVNVHSEAMSPLVCAAEKGQTQLVNYLIRAGADVNQKDYKGMTALYSAARNRNIECIKILVKAGAEVNLTDREGCTPLMVAAANGYNRCLDQLMKTGADVNMGDHMGNTALMWASMADHWKCVSTLIEFGADVNEANNHGDVSLMCAARKGDDQWLTKLIVAGADVNIKNKVGETVFSIASSNNHEKCMSVLIQEGAHVNKDESEICEQIHVVVPMFEEKPDTVDCAVHIGAKKSGTLDFSHVLQCRKIFELLKY